MSVLETVAIAWAAVAGVYLVLFLYHSVVGMKEEDHLYLSAGEAKLEAEQKEIMKSLNRLESVQHKVGWVALAMTILAAGMWGYNVLGELL